MTSREMSGLSKKTVETEFYAETPEGYEKGKTKYVVVVGSVISGVGKGTFTSSLGNLLSLLHGYRVSPVKFDGYLNVDAGTLNPYRHGEVFVLDDGTETDLDLGTYERMMNKNLSKDNYLTAGKLFKAIIDRERSGKYLGRDVQFIPHVTGEIKLFLRKLAIKTDAEIVLVEVGGTVGDLENSYFIEAMRELAYEEGKENVCFINVAYILQPKSLGEHKSKAAQLGLRTLMGLGIQPDIVVCRSEKPIDERIKEKISIFSNVLVSNVVNMYDIGNIHNIPVFLKENGIDRIIIDILKLKSNGNVDRSVFDRWEAFVSKISSAEKEITVGITGKYTTVHDSYLSILKAMEHTVPYFGARVKIKWIETTRIENGMDAKEALKDVDGMIVPGGFGERGTEGKMLCIKYARESNLPFLGICFGFQMAVIEFARNVCGLKDSNSTEINDKTENPIICILPEQEGVKDLGGTMKLGGHEVIVNDRTRAYKMYREGIIRERFRYRYNVNLKYIELLEKNGLVFSGFAPQKRIMQILELPDHRFFVAAQFHPEFTSKPLKPNPLFSGFVESIVAGK